MAHHRRGLRLILERKLAQLDSTESLTTNAEVEPFLDALEHDYTQLPLANSPSPATALTQRQVAMLNFAVKLTATPAAMQPAEVASLRAVDFTDTDILHITEVVAYYAFVNRIADGLGVELESKHGRP